MVVEAVAGLVAGIFLREWSRLIYAMFRKKKPPPPLRDVGDLVRDRVSDLPIVLTKQLSFDKFEACFITPHAKQLGAEVGPRDKRSKVDELHEIILKSTQDREMWPDYTAPLSDDEHRNYAKAMLTDKQ